MLSFHLLLVTLQEGQMLGVKGCTEMFFLQRLG